jgi:CRP-like cAMP-binding protein
LLLQGAADVSIERAGGEPVDLGQLRAPDCFGEIGMLHDRPRVATVRIAKDQPARLISLDRKAFAELARDNDARQALDMISSARLAASDLDAST